MADGTGACLLEAPTGVHDVSSPRFSPDGTRLAVAMQYGNEPPRQSIYALRHAEPSSLARLTADAWDSSPCWSPDGREIAFVRQGQGIMLVGAGGEGLRYLADGESPAWSGP